MRDDRDMRDARMTTRPLFGGAIESTVPDEFTDVSTVRQVPDNQEVFAHAESDRSIIFELLEQEADIPSAEAAPAIFHWNVLARDSGAIESSLTHSRDFPSTEMRPALSAGDEGMSVSVATGVHRVAKFKDTHDKANVVRVSLACVRLPRVTTDLLIAFNDPVSMHPESSSTKMGSSVQSPSVQGEDERAAPLLAALRSLTIKDWSLFG